MEEAIVVRNQIKKLREKEMTKEKATQIKGEIQKAIQRKMTIFDEITGPNFQKCREKSEKLKEKLSEIESFSEEALDSFEQVLL